MAMQNKVYLTVTDWMFDCTLICSRDFADLYQFSLFRTCFEGSQNSCLFFYAHVAVISTVMIARNCFKPVAPIFCHQLAHIGRTKTRCLSHILGTGALGPQFQCFQSALGSFILIFPACLLNRFDFFIAEFISGSHFYHPDIAYHIIAII
ncbi:MAG: hypothetical protein BHW42_03615 [Oscillibacter sp. CAG:241_62_21]|nr:MAG: hypothetical protein BHW42_03615 [Oscillibacter sp. CAG:241_62_21]